MTPSGASKQRASMAGGYALLMVGLCALANLSVNYPMYSMTPLAASVMDLFGIGTAEYSAAVTSPTLAGVVLSIPLGLLADRLGPRVVMVAGALLCAVAMVGRVFMGNYALLMCCMLTLGVGLTALNSSYSKMVMGWVGARWCGTGMSVITAGATLGMFGGLAISGILPGIHEAFLVAAAISCATAALWLLLARNPPSLEDRGTAERDSLSTCLLAVVRCPAAWIIGVALLFNQACNMAFSTYLPLALQQARGLSVAESGVASSMLMVGGLIGTLVGPQIERTMGNTKLYLMITSAAAAALGFVGWMAPRGIVLYVALAAFGALLWAHSAVLIGLPPRVPAIGERFAGTAQGVCSTLMLAGPALLPAYAIAPLAHDDTTILIMLSAACAVAACLATALLRNGMFSFDD